MCRTKPKNNPIVREYILPDYSQNRGGRLRNPGEVLATDDGSKSFQILYMDNERFAVPELIFRPDDIGDYSSPDHLFLIPSTVA